MKMNLFKGKAKRTKTFTLISIFAIAALLALNYLFTYLIQKNALYIDMTPESLYSLSEEMKTECAYIDTLDDGDKEVEIIFCADPDSLISSTVTRVPYFMALQMSREYDNLSVETVNVTYNPTALSKYKATSLTEILPTDVIVSYGSTYRIVKATSFWVTTSEQTYYSYNGEYKMATLIKSVTAVNKPMAYFISNHGETFYDVNNTESESSINAAGLYDLLSERGLGVGSIDLSTQDIPDDCTLLIINDPRFDYNTSSLGNSIFEISETEKIDRYLRKNQGALMVARDHTAKTGTELDLTNLDTFLATWGFKFDTAVVKDSDNHIGSSTDTDKIIGVYESDTNSYANVVYGEYASLASAPNTVFLNTGYVECAFYQTDTVKEPGADAVDIVYNSFMKSYTSAYAEGENEEGVLVTKKQNEALDLAAVTVRYALDEITNEAKTSYVFCTNSKDFFSNTLLYNDSYANFDIVSALVNNISRVDVYASSALGGYSMNSEKFGGKVLIYDTLSESAQTSEIDGTIIEAFTPGVKRLGIIISVSVALIPLVICIVIRIKRKYL